MVLDLLQPVLFFRPGFTSNRFELMISSFLGGRGGEGGFFGEGDLLGPDSLSVKLHLGFI